MAYEAADPHGEDGTDVANGIEADKYEKYLDTEARARLLVLEAKDRAQSLYDEKQSEGHVYTWAQVDHDIAFACVNSMAIPDIGHMVDAAGSPPLGLIYSGEINGVHGDSEAGKSWLALWICVQEMRRGRVVMYVDFEDSAGRVYDRLMKLGAPRSMIVEFFRYVNPQNRLSTFEQIEFGRLVNIDAPKSIAVIDGVTEAMALESLTGRDEGEVAKWHQLVTKPLAANGWGPFTIDHTPHGESRQIGSQHKRSAITGVSYAMESIASFAPGQKGRSRLRVDKDRPGGVRGEAAPGSRPQWYGDFTLDATTTMLDACVWPWLPETQAQQQGYEERPPEAVMDAVCSFVDKNQGCTGRTIRTAVKGRAQSVLWALDHLVETGVIKTKPGPRNASLHYLSDDLEAVVPSGSELVPGTSESAVPPDTPVGGSGNHSTLPYEIEEGGNQ